MRSFVVQSTRKDFRKSSDRLAIAKERARLSQPKGALGKRDWRAGLTGYISKLTDTSS